MQYVSNAPLWIINGNDGKSLPLNSPRPSGLLATSQTHWASWAQCWEDTPPELCWSPSSHTASKCGETSPPAGRQENSRVHYPDTTITKHNKTVNLSQLPGEFSPAPCSGPEYSRSQKTSPPSSLTHNSSPTWTEHLQTEENTQKHHLVCVSVYMRPPFTKGHGYDDLNKRQKSETSISGQKIHSNLTFLCFLFLAHVTLSPIRMGLASLCLLQRCEGLFRTSGHDREHMLCMCALRKVIRIDYHSITTVFQQTPCWSFMASVAEPWLMCGYFIWTILFVVKPCLISVCN